MVKRSEKMEEKEEGWCEGCFECDDEQEVEAEVAWTKWAFSVLKRPDQSLEIRWEGLTTPRVLVRV